MTIEKTIQDLTTAVIGLTEALAAQIETIKGITPASEHKPVIVKKEPKTTDAEIVPETKSEAPKAKKPAKAPEPKVEEDLAGDEEITVDTLRERTMAFSEAKGREATIALLAKYGAKKGSEVAVDKCAAYVAEINKALGV
jgi:hypothetical protein